MILPEKENGFPQSDSPDELRFEPVIIGWNGGSNH